MDEIKEVVNEKDESIYSSSFNTAFTARDIEVLNIMKESNDKNEVMSLAEKDEKIYFHQVENFKTEYSMDIQDMIIDYFSEYMKKNILFGEEEIIFMKLNDEMKIRIFEKLSGEIH